VPCGQPDSVNLVLHEGRVLHGTNCFISVCISALVSLCLFLFVSGFLLHYFLVHALSEIFCFLLFYFSTERNILWS